MAEKFDVRMDIIILSQTRFFRRERHCIRMAPGFHELSDLFRDECNFSMTRSHRSKAEMPSERKLASEEILTFVSMELCETAVCFLHIQQSGTNVQLLNMHQMPLKQNQNLEMDQSAFFPSHDNTA